jgi:hypothetical protein
MGKRDDLIEKYAEDLKKKCKMDPNMDLLKQVTIACGPSIYNRDSSTVSGSDEKELATVRDNFVMKKLGVKDEKKAMAGVHAAIETYGKSNRTKHRAVVYYLLTKHFKKDSVFKK